MAVRAAADLAGPSHRERKADEEDQMGRDADQPVPRAPDRLRRGDLAVAEFKDEEVPRRVNRDASTRGAGQGQSQQRSDESPQRRAGDSSEGESPG